jgi:type II secretory pathway predicted ATPase ExeA
LYGAFYGLNARPFDLTADPRFLFLTGRQREALANLRYGLTTPRGFTLLLGEAGTGKTTLLRTVLSGIQDARSRHILVSNPTLSRSEFHELIAREFDLGHAAWWSKATFLTELRRHLDQRFAAGGLTNLVVDEAQCLPPELLEELRLLGNMETTTAKLLNVVLAGQPELGARLNEPAFRQLKQRISLRCSLGALTREETAAYIAGRLRIAGGSPTEVFTSEAIGAICEAAGGIPRTINVVCDNALIGGFAEQVKPIPIHVVEDVCRDFDLPFGGPPAAAHDQGQSARGQDSGARDESGSGRPELFAGVGRRRRFLFF